MSATQDGHDTGDGAVAEAFGARSFASVKLSTEFYALEAVRETMEAFADLASFRLEEGLDDHAQNLTVVIADPLDDVRDLIADEFCNHALAGTILRRNNEEAPIG